MLLLSLLVLCDAETGHGVKREDASCDGLLFDHVYFDREILMENLGRPYNLVMHKPSSTLFFSHNIHKGSEMDFEILTCNINTKKCDTIKEVPGGYAIAYDSGNDDIYFGGHNGIYKYIYETKTAEFFAEEGKSIWGLFVRKNFFYIEHPSQKLHVYVDDKFIKVAEAVKIEIDNFFVSKRNDVYFSNKTALYKVEKLSRRTIMLNDEVFIRQIVEDGYGDLYFCGTDGIYIEDKPYDRVKKVADIDNAFGLAFDEHDNVIYSNKETVYRLVPSNKGIKCYENALHTDFIDLTK